MIKSQNKYFEGDLFLVPVYNSEPVVGLIARLSKDKMLGYFFKHNITKGAEFSDVKKIILKENILLIHMCSLLGFTKGEWKFFGKMDYFKNFDFEIPTFKRVDVLSGECFEVLYNNNLEEVNCIKVSDCETLDGFPEDGLAGYQFIQKRLSRILNLK